MSSVHGVVTAAFALGDYAHVVWLVTLSQEKKCVHTSTLTSVCNAEVNTGAGRACASLNTATAAGGSCTLFFYQNTYNSMYREDRRSALYVELYVFCQEKKVKK